MKKSEKSEKDYLNEIKLLEEVNTSLKTGYIKNINKIKFDIDRIRLSYHTLESISEIITVTDLKDNFTYVNQAFLDAYGYKKEEVLGKNPGIIFSPRNRKDLLAEIYKQTRIGTWKGEIYNLTKKGKEILIELTTSQLKDDKGNVLGLVGISKDITENKRIENALRESETKLRAIFESSRDAIGVSKNGVNYFANPAFLEMFGFKRNEELAGTSILDIIAPECHKQIFEIFRNKIDRESVHSFYEMRGRRTDGTLFDIEVNVSSYDLGETFTLVAIREITRRKLAEKELELYRNNLEELVKIRTEELYNVNQSLKREIVKEKEYEMLLKESLEKEKELSEMKSRFISTASHEFRTPLTAILSSAEIIHAAGDKLVQDKKDEHFKRIRDSVYSLTKLLEDILTLSRAESGKISFKPEHIDLYKFAHECIEDARPLSKENHRLNFIYKSDRRKYVLDPKLLRFILNNLLSNAIKYSPKGGNVQLSIFEDKKYLVLQVDDEGIGIPESEIEYIFESFYRTSNAIEFAGTGLGLAIVKHAVELHNGKIEVKSELNKGTAFFVKLPIRLIHLNSIIASE